MNFTIGLISQELMCEYSVNSFSCNFNCDIYDILRFSVYHRKRRSVAQNSSPSLDYTKFFILFRLFTREHSFHLFSSFFFYSFYSFLFIYFFVSFFFLILLFFSSLLLWEFVHEKCTSLDFENEAWWLN